MTSMVDSPAVPVPGAPIWPLSVAAYLALGELGLIPKNTELLYGFVYTKRPKSPLHSTLCRSLKELLERAVPPGYLVDCEQPISCKDSMPEPDFSILRGTKEDYRFQHPTTAELVIEVCVTSHDYDRSKLRAYASAGVKECWLVLGPEKQIEIYRQPQDDQFAERQVHGPGGTVTGTVLPAFTLALNTLFAT